MATIIKAGRIFFNNTDNVALSISGLTSIVLTAEGENVNVYYSDGVVYASEVFTGYVHYRAT